MKPFLSLLVLGTVILGVWWSYSGTKEIVTAEHERFKQSLERIRRLDSAFNQDVLRVRFRLLENYDSLGEQVGDVRQALADLSPTPGFVDAAARVAIELKIGDLSRRLNEQADRVEAFKSQNAILKNSLHYFPLAGRELVDRLAAAGNRRHLEGLINELMGEVLAYSVAPGAEQERQIQDALAQIGAWRARHAGDAEARFLATLVTHVGTILKRRPRVDALVGELVSPATAHLAEEATQLYEEQFSKAVRSVQGYRTLLYAFCLVLLGGFAYALYALARNNKELQAARDNLEKCVAKRTGELDQANQALQAANEQLSRLALYDALTGLPNRMLLESRMAQAVSVAERGGKPFALMFVDLDRFKPVNDAFGHGVGDELLKSVAQRLAGCVRKADTVARTGGDEFVVVLSEIADPRDAAVIAGKILEELARPFRLDRHEVNISGSIGISVFPRDARDVNRLKVNADEAMYQAKRGGRSNYRFFVPTDGSRLMAA